MYYIAETEANGFANNPALWKKTNAQTMEAAKRAASGARMFQRTAAWVGAMSADGTIQAIAVKRCDAISGKPHTWINM